MLSSEKTRLSSSRLKRLADHFLQPIAPKNFNIQLWDGSPLQYSDNPEFTLYIRNPKIGRKLFFHHDLIDFLEAYIRKDIDIKGDLLKAMDLKNCLNDTFSSPNLMTRLLKATWKLQHRHTQKNDKKDVSFHYDLSNDFYRLFLDEEMVYSCAYFRSGEESIDAAQQQKLEHLCRKLQLKRGDHLLDVGCGWGALILYAAKNYQVTTHGITLSQEQYSLAQERIQQAGLETLCKVELRDYRDLPGKSVYDKIVSVGMFEHVGIKNYPVYFQRLHQLLKDDGIFVNHTITKPVGFAWKANGGEFLDRYIFPGGELDNISHILSATEQSEWEVQDVESLRNHYALTLRHWFKNLEQNQDDAIEMIGEKKYRVWQLYLAGCSHAFHAGELSIYQVIAHKRRQDASLAPYSREYLYR